MNSVEAAAAKLNNGEYRHEGSPQLFAEMKAAGLVAVFGASDDLVELEGAIGDELGAYGGSEIYLTRAGLVKNDCDDENCPHFQRAKERASVIEALWSVDGFSWKYRTKIPHAKFVINEDGEPYCEGIVFALSDVPP